MEWRPIPDWPAYEVSNHGDVRRASDGGSPIAKRGKVLRRNLVGRYYRVSLHCPTRGRMQMMVHRAVAIAFIGPPPSPTHQVAHGDNNGLNNRPENLRWATQAENMADQIEHGTRRWGNRHAQASLSEAQVEAMRIAAKRGVSHELIAALADTTVSAVGRIVRGETRVRG